MNYYPRYPAHYVAKTLHLTMEQDGAYTRLLDWCYSNERPVPHAQRFAISRATTPSEKRSTDAVLCEFFSRDGDSWQNGRVSDELEAAAPKIEAARINGRKGGRPKKPTGFSENNPVGFQDGTHNEPTAKAPQSPIPSITTETEEYTHPESSASESGVCGPAVQAAILLNKLGCRITPSNPDLIAAIAEGVDPAELEALAKQFPGKPAGYVLTAARRQRAEGARPIVHAAATPVVVSQTTSKTAQAFAKLEVLKNGNATGSSVVSSSDFAGPAMPALLGPGRAASG